jgi:methylenetetrahydrofolate reductase (NADPH)
VWGAGGCGRARRGVEECAECVAGPLYVDVTWGAGGSTSDLTLQLCVDAKQRFGLEPNMHLTCTNMPEEKIGAALEGARAAGISNVVALRGDPPAGAKEWTAVAGGFSCALDLVRHVRKEYGSEFCLSVAGYPEGHPNVIKKVADVEALSATERLRLVELEDGAYVCHDEDYARELAYLKEKVDAGADLIITQMFFDVAVFLQFVQDCRAAGIACPIIPGIMLVQAYGGFQRMTAFCKSRVPRDVRARFDAVKDDDAKVREAGIELGVEMSKRLLDAGVTGLHYYCLNLSAVVNAVLERLHLVEEGTLDRADATPITPASVAGSAAAATGGGASGTA